MNPTNELSSLRPARLAKSLIASLATCFFVLAMGCADTGDPAGDDPVDASASSSTPARDAGGSSVIPGIDAGPSAPFDAGIIQRAVDAAVPAGDAGSAKADAATASDSGLTIPNLFPTNDAGPTPALDAGTGTRDVHGPCKNLNLICFDIFDMWINAECATCNAGKGCQGCAIPYAY